MSVDYRATIYYGWAFTFEEYQEMRDACEGAYSEFFHPDNYYDLEGSQWILGLLCADVDGGCFYEFDTPEDILTPEEEEEFYKEYSQILMACGRDDLLDNWNPKLYLRIEVS